MAKLSHCLTVTFSKLIVKQCGNVTMKQFNSLLTIPPWDYYQDIFLMISLPNSDVFSLVASSISLSKS